MTEMDQTNTLDGDRGATSPPHDLEQAQIICVIGKASFTVVFLLCHAANRRLLGGPGVGKGTQCARLVTDLDVAHLSVGDLLRNEANQVFAKQGIDIMAYMRDGKLVPKETVQGVLENELVSTVKAGKTRILLDGFPRSMDQAELFEANVSTLNLPKAVVRAVNNSTDNNVGFQDQGSLVVSRIQRDFAWPSAQSIQDLWPR